MKRTNINLEENQHDYVKTLAEQEGKSISEVIREAIEALREKQKKRMKDDPIYAIIGMGSSDGGINTEDHDDVLYPKKSS